MNLKNFILPSVAVVLMTASALWVAGYRINYSASLPKGIWQVSKTPLPPKQGEYVSFCPNNNVLSEDAYKLGYLKFGFCPGFYTPLLKQVAGVPGDLVETTSVVSINGTVVFNSGVKTSDSKGRKIPWKSTNQILKDDQIFAMATMKENSFDSRYFGPVHLGQIIGTARPIWVW